MLRRECARWQASTTTAIETGTLKHRIRVVRFRLKTSHCRVCIIGGSLPKAESEALTYRGRGPVTGRR